MRFGVSHVSQGLSDVVFLAVHALAGTLPREFVFILKRFAKMNVNSWMTFDFEETIRQSRVDWRAYSFL
jgi:hypothetical protein